MPSDTWVVTEEGGSQIEVLCSQKFFFHNIKFQGLASYFQGSPTQSRIICTPRSIGDGPKDCCHQHGGDTWSGEVMRWWFVCLSVFYSELKKMAKGKYLKRNCF
jgi:hypothetical protein